MSVHIPFDIQTEIMKRLPVKSLLQFRSVTKQWKSFIDSPKFIKYYHVNHTNPQHHLLLRYKLDIVQTYTLITDNDTFPQQKVPLTTPKSLSLSRNAFILNSVNGVLCFCDHGGLNLSTMKVVIWNPAVRKYVRIVVPWPKSVYITVGFGVCPDTSDPKLVKVNISNNKISSVWVVEVFSLSTRIWKTVYMGAPFKSCKFFMRCQVFVNGVIYFVTYDDTYDGARFYFVISFDFKNERFGEVCIPERLVHTYILNVAKVNESLGLLEDYDEGGKKVCGVWIKKNGANNPFTKNGMGLYNGVLGFRNNGDVVIEVVDGNSKESRIGVYEPLSGHINDVGINGDRRGYFCATSYMETLLLLDESDSIIY